MPILLIAKSFVAAHTRRLSTGKVVHVGGFDNHRSKRVDAKHDDRTPDMFRPTSRPVPKREIPEECARNPENCTPDLFSGKTKRDATSFNDKFDDSVPSRRSKPTTDPIEARESGAGDTVDRTAWAKKVVANKDMMPWRDVKEAHAILGIEDEDIEWAKKQIKQSKPDGKAASRELYEMGKKYHQSIPISQALDALKKHGLNGVDDDGSPWEGMLTGRDGRAHIDLADASGKVVNGMAIQWHKMDSGRYEFNAYLTGAVMHKSQPRILLIKSHIDTYVKQDGAVVNAHDDKRVALEHFVLPDIAAISRVDGRRLSNREIAAKSIEDRIAIAKDEIYRNHSSRSNKNIARVFRLNMEIIKEIRKVTDAERVKDTEERYASASAYRKEKWGAYDKSAFMAEIQAVPSYQEWHSSFKQEVAGYLDNWHYDLPPKMRDFDGIGKKATLELIQRKAKKMGIEQDYLSSKNTHTGGSVYLKRSDGEVIRVSDHDLPDTPQREHNRSIGLTGRWGGEVIIDDWLGTSADEYIHRILHGQEEEDAPTSSGNPSNAGSRSQSVSETDMQERRKVRADKSGSSEEPAQTGGGAGSKKTLAKSFFFVKSHVDQYQRKDGTIVKEHDDKRTKKAEEVGQGRKPAQPDAAGGEAKPAKYGTHNVDEGDSIKFTAGSFEGAGKVKSVGQDGATVTDESGRDHNVHWHEMHGRAGGSMSDGDEKKPPEDAQDKPAGDEQGKPDGKPEKAQRKFFDPAEVEKMPHKDTVAQTVFKSWQEAEKLAPAAHEEYTNLLKGMGEKIGFQPGRGSPDKMNDADLDSEESFIFMGPIKQEGKSTKKVNSDYKGDWTKLKDLVRATIAVKSIDDVHSALEGLKGAGLEFAQKPKDNMTNGTKDGYRDLNLILKLPESGMLVELQIAVKQISKVKGDAHRYYNENVALDQKRKEAWGAIESSGNGVAEPSQRYNHDDEDLASNWPDQADYKSFMANRKKQQEIYGGAWAKVPGIDQILKALAWAKGKMVLFFKGVKHVH